LSADSDDDDDDKIDDVNAARVADASDDVIRIRLMMTPSSSSRVANGVRRSG
jgi:hypothetical protein